MKIQLDTTAKTVKVEESVNLGELINGLKKLLPNNEWKEFKLETGVQIVQWSNPIIYTRPIYWWEQPWYNGTTGSSLGSFTTNDVSIKSPDAYTLTEGIFNVEL